MPVPEADPPPSASLAAVAAAAAAALSASAFSAAAFSAATRTVSASLSAASFWARASWAAASRAVRSASARAWVSTASCCDSACWRMRWRRASPASACPCPWPCPSACPGIPAVRAAGAAVSAPAASEEWPPPSRSGRSGSEGMDIATCGRSWAVAMPPAPTAAITPTPSTVELRASPPRCLRTRCLPRTERAESSVGFHSPQAPAVGVSGTSMPSGEGELEATGAHSS